jgi:hypothetical protein
MQSNHLLLAELPVRAGCLALSRRGVSIQEAHLEKRTYDMALVVLIILLIITPVAFCLLIQRDNRKMERQNLVIVFGAKSIYVFRYASVSFLGNLQEPVLGATHRILLVNGNTIYPLAEEDCDNFLTPEELGCVRKEMASISHWTICVVRNNELAEKGKAIYEKQQANAEYVWRHPPPPTGRIDSIVGFF